MSYSEVLLPESIQQAIEVYALQFLRQGRVDWDEPHTRAVVYYAVLLAKSENQDLATMFATAWLHDIGYYGLFAEAGHSSNWDHIKDRKAQHMIVGGQKSTEFLHKPNIKPHFNEVQIARIPHLVSVHDNIEELSAPDEILIMEADTLGAMDIKMVKPTFNKAGFQKYRETGMPRRWAKFATPLGRKIYQALMPELVKYFDEQD